MTDKHSIDEAKIRAYLQCGILQRWHSKTFEQFTNDAAALKIVKHYLSELDEAIKSNAGLFLYGNNGTGKSHVMNCAFKEILSKGYSVRVVSATSLVSRFIRGWDEDGMADLIKPHFLAIEELGKEYSNTTNSAEFGKHALEHIIRRRLQSNKITWFTSNLTPADIQTKYSEHIYSMLKESSVSVKIGGLDFRGNIQKELNDKFYNKALK